MLKRLYAPAGTVFARHERLIALQHPEVAVLVQEGRPASNTDGTGRRSSVELCAVIRYDQGSQQRSSAVEKQEKTQRMLKAARMVVLSAEEA